MSDESCGCSEPTVEPSIERTTSDRWIDEEPAAAAPLPPDVASVMSQFYGTESVETLDEFVAATRAVAGGGSIDVEDLCHVDGETPHRATTGDDTYYFRCFYDGVALAYLADESVEIRTESPAGKPIEARASPDGTIDATPMDSVMSLGIGRDVEVPPDGDPSVGDVYEAICPYVKAFPSRESYESWAAAVDGATVGMPLAAGMPIAAALTEEA